MVEHYNNHAHDLSDKNMVAETPFLSIVTRCHPRGREQMLERNKQSVIMQTDQDWEHVFISNAGNTRREADKSFVRVKDRIRGKYVFILDDDDYIVDPDFVACAKSVAKEADNPDVIMVKMRFLRRGGKLLPDAARWGKPPVMYKIAVSCYLVKRGIWLKHIEVFDYPDFPDLGDFWFIRRLFDVGCSIYWWDQVVAEVNHQGGVHDLDLGEK